MAIKNRVSSIETAAPMTLDAVQKFLKENGIKTGKVTPRTSATDAVIELTKGVCLQVGDDYVAVNRPSTLTFWPTQNKLGKAVLDNISDAMKK